MNWENLIKNKITLLCYIRCFNPREILYWFDKKNEWNEWNKWNKWNEWNKWNKWSFIR